MYACQTQGVGAELGESKSSWVHDTTILFLLVDRKIMKKCEIISCTTVWVGPLWPLTIIFHKPTKIAGGGLVVGGGRYAHIY